MRACGRWLGPIAAMTLIAAPIGPAAIVLILAAGLNLAVLGVIRRDLVGWRRASARRSDEGVMLLHRRTVPHLRARRPFGVVEAQVRWRHASEAHRRGRELSFSLVKAPR